MDRSAAHGVDGPDNNVPVDSALLQDEPPPIRIARIGGRYLVFDVAGVARLRRHHNLCAVLVGITPQAPNQCLFSGLPLELTADEVRWLVCDRQRRGAAAAAPAVVVVDDCARHLARLPLPEARRGLKEAAARQRDIVAVTVAEEAAERARRGAEARARKTGEAREAPPKTTGTRPPPSLRITPTTSDGLGGDGPADGLAPAALFPGPPSPPAALRALLARRGYYTTPGLRFGGALSVYPGDPFRYHAHFVTMAPAAYARDAPVPLLDVVGTGRLATGVKKGLLLGGVVGTEGQEDQDTVRTFTLEWAAM